MTEQTQVQVTLPGRPAWAEILILLISLGAMAGMLLAMMPAQERQALVMAVRQKRTDMHRGLSARAREAGRAGMADELDGKPQGAGVWYMHARALSWWRDRLGGRR